ncbi:MAG: septum formation family protein [Micropruina sp.]|uniref:septum formation family protein n=1 Tax=Micropruina sp. TaxID=2737536 RepID=UPI0039E22DD5
MNRASRMLTGFALAGLLLTGCSTGAPRNTAGQVTASASVDPFQITVGDCTGPMAEGDIESLQVAPCDTAHNFEAYATTELTGSEYPGDPELKKQADKFCSAEFRSFVGLAAKDSRYDMFYLYPVQDSWAIGDREVLCLAGSTKGGIKGSLKGVAK